MMLLQSTRAQPFLFSPLRSLGSLQRNHPRPIHHLHHDSNHDSNHCQMGNLQQKLNINQKANFHSLSHLERFQRRHYVAIKGFSKATETLKSLVNLNPLNLNSLSLSSLNLNSLPAAIKKEIPLLVEFENLIAKLVPLSVFPDVPASKILLGLYYLWQEKKAEQLLHKQALGQMLKNGGAIPEGFAPRYPNFDPARVLRDRARIEKWMYLAEITDTIYAAGAPKGMSRKTMLKKEKIVEGLWKPQLVNGTWKPAHFVAVDDYSKTIMLVVRGTKSFHDITTDIGVRVRPFQEASSSSVHSGMGDAAEMLALDHKALLQRLIAENPGYQVQCIGHSLGGSVAALAAIILKKEIPEIQATSFASPPCVSGDTAEDCKDYVTSLVLRDDLFVRFSLGSLTRLLLELRDHEWDSAIKLDLKNDLGDFVLGLKRNALFTRALEETRMVDKVSSWFSLEDPAAATKEDGMRRRSGRLKKDLEKAYSDFVLDSKEHVEMYSPGRIYHIVERDELGLSGHEDLDNGGPIQDNFCVVESAKEHFRTILLTESMIQDHKNENYAFALREALKRLY